MKKIILAPDSFKGTLSSLEITTILDKIIKEKYPNIEVHKLPIADGGENSLEVIQEIVNGLFITKNVCGPNFNNINSKYLIKDTAGYTCPPVPPLVTTIFMTNFLSIYTN